MAKLCYSVVTNTVGKPSKNCIYAYCCKNTQQKLQILKYFSNVKHRSNSMTTTTITTNTITIAALHSCDYTPVVEEPRNITRYLPKNEDRSTDLAQIQWRVTRYFIFGNHGCFALSCHNVRFQEQSYSSGHCCKSFTSQQWRLNYGLRWPKNKYWLV